MDYTTWLAQNKLEDTPANKLRYRSANLKPYKSIPKPGLHVVDSSGRFISGRAGSYKDLQGKRVDVKQGEVLGEGAPKGFRQINPEYSTGAMGGMFLGAQLGAEMGKGEDPMFRLGAVLGGAIAGLFKKDFGEKVKHQKAVQEWQEEQKISNITSSAEDRRARIGGQLESQAIKAEIETARFELDKGLRELDEQAKTIQVSTSRHKMLDDFLESTFELAPYDENARNAFKDAKKQKLLALGVYQKLEEITDEELNQYPDQAFLRTEFVKAEGYNNVYMLRSKAFQNVVFGFYGQEGNLLTEEQLRQSAQTDDGKTPQQIEDAYKRAGEMVDDPNGTYAPLLEGFSEKTKPGKRLELVKSIADRLLSNKNTPYTFFSRNAKGTSAFYNVTVNGNQTGTQAGGPNQGLRINPTKGTEVETPAPAVAAAPAARVRFTDFRTQNPKALAVKNSGAVVVNNNQPSIDFSKSTNFLSSVEEYTDAAEKESFDNTDINAVASHANIFVRGVHEKLAEKKQTSFTLGNTTYSFNLPPYDESFLVRFGDTFRKGVGMYAKNISVTFQPKESIAPIEVPSSNSLVADVRTMLNKMGMHDTTINPFNAGEIREGSGIFVPLSYTQITLNNTPGYSVQPRIVISKVNGKYLIESRGVNLVLPREWYK